MTKKHYEAIAAIINDETITMQHEDGDTSLVLWKDDTVRRLTDYFATDNPRFDRARFLEACGDKRQEKYCKECMSTPCQQQ